MSAVYETTTRLALIAHNVHKASMKKIRLLLNTFSVTALCAASLFAVACSNPRTTETATHTLTNTYWKLKILGDAPITVYGDGKQTRSFQYVSDLVEGVFRLLFTNDPNPVNIGNPAELSVMQFAETIRQLTGTSSTIAGIAS